MTTRERLAELIEECLLDGWAEEYTEHTAAKLMASHLIANGVTVQEWHPASDPPKKCGEYNVMIRGGEIATTLFYSVRHKGWYFFDDDDHEEPQDVTHWMPLPQPPKGVE